LPTFYDWTLKDKANRKTKKPVTNVMLRKFKKLDSPPGSTDRFRTKTKMLTGVSFLKYLKLKDAL
jgi:hypothetical protein